MSNILFIKNGSKLKVNNKSIVVIIDEETKEIPISEISAVVIESLQCSITAATNVLCNTNCIPIIYCDDKHSPIAISNSFNTYHKQLFRIKEQIEWTDSRKQKLFLRIIKSKIVNQLELLKYLHKDLDVIDEIEIKLSNINDSNFIETEAVVAKLYFNQLFEDDFVRFAEDEINTSLNYGYAILRSVIKQMIVAKGLVPPIGLWHKSQFNNYNLADDIIEIYRPIVDFVVYHFVIKDGNFTNEERVYLQNTIFQKVKYGNSVFEYRESISLYIDQIIKFMNKEIKEIEIPKLDSELYEY